MTDPVHCQHFGICGGCSHLKTPYQQQLENKYKFLTRILEQPPHWSGSLESNSARSVNSVTNSQGGKHSSRKKPKSFLNKNPSSSSIKIHSVLPSPQVYDYRHKVQLPFGRRKIGRKTVITLGLHNRDKSFIVDQAECRIQDQGLTQVVRGIRQWARKENLSSYNEKSGTGLLRHVVLRKSYSTGEILVAIVINAESLPRSKDLSKSLFVQLRSTLGKNSSLGKLVGILTNTNTKNTHMVLGKKTELLWGRPYLLEKVGKLKFKVNIQNFIQVNPFQTEGLYNIVLSHIPNGSKVVDAYAGMGTIGMWVAGKAEKVVCAEENPDSFRSGLEAIKTNQLKNVRFKKGKTEDILPEIMESGDWDTVVFDPPRIGLDPKAIQTILEHKPPQIIYVSCDPVTFKRDLDLLGSEYICEEIYPVDLFPQTEHLELVGILKKRLP